MPNNYDDLDLLFSFNGDLDLGWDNDFLDTSDDGLKSVLQDIHTIAASSFNDWKLYPNLGATLDSFIGEPNIKSTADAIHDRLKIAIISAGVVAEEDLNIRVIPVHRHKVLIVVRINAISTPFNKLEAGSKLSTQLVFDFTEQGVFFLEKTPIIAKEY